MKSFTARYKSKIDPSKEITLRFWAHTYEEAEKEARNFLLIDQWDYQLLENGDSGKITKVD